MAVAVDLTEAQFVIERKKVIDIKLLGEKVSTREDFLVDVGKQSLSDIRFLLRAITVQETVNQRRLNNQATRLIVDNREGKPLAAAQRKTETQFGDQLDHLMLKAIEKSIKGLMKNAVRRVLKNTPSLRPDEKAGIAALASGGNWEWRYAAKATEQARSVDPYRLGGLSPGALLIYMPQSRYASLANMLAARIDAGWKGGNLWKRGRSGGRGFMERGVSRIRRNRLLKNYDIKIAFTRKFALPGEIYHPGTGDRKEPKSTVCVVVQAIRRGKGYRKR